MDPSHRLVAAELERRLNEALKHQAQIEEELAALQRHQSKPLSAAAREELSALGHDVRRLWDHPNSPPEFKKRILRTVVKEIMASAAGDTIRLVLHLQGGDHTELTLQKTRTGHTRYVTDTDTIDLIRSFLLCGRLRSREYCAMSTPAMRSSYCRAPYDAPCD